MIYFPTKNIVFFILLNQIYCIASMLSIFGNFKNLAEIKSTPCFNISTNKIYYKYIELVHAFFPYIKNHPIFGK